MRRLALVVSFLSVVAAGVAAADDPARSRPPPRAEAPASPPSPDRPAAPTGWTAALRASVMQGCTQALPHEDVCSCLTRELEALSRDSQVVTAEDIQTGLQRCRSL